MKSDNTSRIDEAIAKIVNGRCVCSQKRGLRMSPKARAERNAELAAMSGREELAKKMVAATNCGRRRRHSYREVVDFLLSLPEQIESVVEFDGDGFMRNDCCDKTDHDYLSAQCIVLRRSFTVKLFGWEFTFDEKGGEWILHGMIFPRDEDSRIKAVRELSYALSAFVRFNIAACDSQVTKCMVRSALLNFQCEHCFDCSDTFYIKECEGPLFLRTDEYDGEEEYFAKLTPITLEDAVETFLCSSFDVYER